MHDWIHIQGAIRSRRPEECLRHWMKDELGVEYRGLGFYTTDTDTMLVTIQDRLGERASGDVSKHGTGEDYRLVVYVSNQPFYKTVWNTIPQYAMDSRSK